MFFKYLLNENSGSCFAKMPVAKDKIKQFSGLYSYYQNMIKEEQMLLMSDESFTVNPLNRFMRFIVKRCAEVVGELEDQEACYRNGFSLSEYLLGSRDQLSQSFKEQLIESNTISFKIQRCLDALGAEWRRCWPIGTLVLGLLHISCNLLKQRERILGTLKALFLLSCCSQSLVLWFVVIVS